MVEVFFQGDLLLSVLQHGDIHDFRKMQLSCRAMQGVCQKLKDRLCQGLIRSSFGGRIYLVSPSDSVPDPTDPAAASEQAGERKEEGAVKQPGELEDEQSHLTHSVVHEELRNSRGGEVEGEGADTDRSRASGGTNHLFYLVNDNAVKLLVNKADTRSREVATGENEERERMSQIVDGFKDSQELEEGLPLLQDFVAAFKFFWVRQLETELEDQQGRLAPIELELQNAKSASPPWDVRLALGAGVGGRKESERSSGFEGGIAVCCLPAVSSLHPHVRAPLVSDARVFPPQKQPPRSQDAVCARQHCAHQAPQERCPRRAGSLLLLSTSCSHPVRKR